MQATSTTITPTPEGLDLLETLLDFEKSRVEAMAGQAEALFHSLLDCISAEAGEEAYQAGSCLYAEARNRLEVVEERVEALQAGRDAWVEVAYATDTEDHEAGYQEAWDCGLEWYCFKS